MKKFILSLFVAASALAASAITVTEAYEQIAAMPGAQLSDVPGYEHIKTDKGRLKDDMDWGKVVMLMGVPQTTLDDVAEVVAEITDEKVLDTVAQGSNTVKGYRHKVDDNTYLAIVVVQMPVGCVTIYAQGGEDVISKMNIN